MKNYTFFKLFFFELFLLKALDLISCSWFIVWLPIIIIPFLVTIDIVGKVMKSERQKSEIDKLDKEFEALTSMFRRPHVSTFSDRLRDKMKEQEGATKDHDLYGEWLTLCVKGETKLSFPAWKEKRNKDAAEKL